VPSNKLLLEARFVPSPTLVQWSLDISSALSLQWFGWLSLDSPSIWIRLFRIDAHPSQFYERMRQVATTAITGAVFLAQIYFFPFTPTGTGQAWLAVLLTLIVITPVVVYYLTRKPVTTGPSGMESPSA
jgi:hypothetical protein